MLIAQLALATAMVLVMVAVQLVGLGLLNRALHRHSRLFRKLPIATFTLLVTAAVGIIAVHTVEIWLWALLYAGLEAFPTFEDALYFSTVTYAAIGYGDLLMPHDWRVLGAIEGGAGTVMFGWSIAYNVSLLSQLRVINHDWLKLGSGDDSGR